MSIDAVSTETKNTMRRASVYSLPTSPKDSGKKEVDVKDAMYKPNELMLEEIDRVITATNAALNSMQGRVDELEESTFDSDSITTAVDYQVVDNKVKTFTADDITSVNIKIPEGVTQGFSAQVNFKTGTTAPAVTFENSSGLTLKKVLYGSIVNSYAAPADAVVKMLIDSDDGMNVYVWIIDVK